MAQTARSNARFDVCIEALDRRQALGPHSFDASQYLGVATAFCPYIGPAIDAGTMFQSAYALSDLQSLSAKRYAAEGLLYVAIVHTEWFRLRRARTHPKLRQLICDTIVIADDEGLDWPQLASVVMWPHWLLKQLYSHSGIMFANFWRGYCSKAADSRDIPPPPRTFMAMRSAIPPRDARFMSTDPTLAGDIRDSSDEGQNVHLPIAAVSVVDTLSAAALAHLDYFDKARSWGRCRWPDDIRQRFSSIGSRQVTE
jgi:hypothetical protein